MYPKILQKFDNFLVNTIDKYANFRWYNSPLAKNIKATKEEYLKIAAKSKENKYPIVSRFEAKYKFAINENWYHELALHTQIIIRNSETCYVHGRLLYSALSNYIKNHNLKNINILETGTARGFSSLCMAKAMEDADIEGKIITFDVLPHNVKMFWNCIDDHEGKKTRAELLLNYNKLIERYIIFHHGNTKTELKKVQMPRVHFAFLDCGHEYHFVMNELATVYDKQQKGDIIFFDDYTPKIFPGVVRAVDEICEKYKYSKEVITISNERGYVIAEKL